MEVKDLPVLRGDEDACGMRRDYCPFFEFGEIPVGKCLDIDYDCFRKCMLVKLIESNVGHDIWNSELAIVRFS